MELMKDAIPGATLAVATAKMSESSFQSMKSVTGNISGVSGSDKQDHFLWKLIEDSMIRGHQSNQLGELMEKKVFGANRLGDQVYLWFAWPAIT